MIPTTDRENEIISQIMFKVFGAEITPGQIKGLQAWDETVVVVTPYALYSLGKDYFRQLVEEIKGEAIQVEAQAELDQYIEEQSICAIRADGKGSRQVQAVTLLDTKGFHSVWQVIGETGNPYLLMHSPNYSRCSCKAGRYGRSCYHAKAVQDAVGGSCGNNR